MEHYINSRYMFCVICFIPKHQSEDSLNSIYDLVLLYYNQVCLLYIYIKTKKLPHYKI